jgi:hypothetical protein
MTTGRLVLALLLLPILLVGGLALRDARGREALLPGLDDPEDVARIEIARGREQVVLARRLDTGRWEILSAADAPGDAERIEAAIRRLSEIRAMPVAAGTPPPRREPLEVRLTGRDGRELGHAALWTNEARRLPDGPRLALEKAPALPLWPSAWSSLTPPVIDATKVAQVERLTDSGAEPLDSAAAAQVATLLGRLSATDFMPGSSVNWAGARQLRVTMSDGRLIDVQQVSDGDGRYFLRLASETDPAIRQARRFAFRTTESLP